MGNILQTEKGSEWLDQFDQDDKADASTLATSVKLIERTDVEEFVSKKLLELGQINNAGSNAVFAIRELLPDFPEDGFVTDSSDEQKKKLRSVRIDGEKKILTRKTAQLWKLGKLKPAPYFPPKRSTRPISVSSGSGVGSEGPMANLIRDTCALGGSRWLDHPSIEEMAETKTRTIFVVDDIIGSGTRLNDFLTGFFLNKTIRSWRSYKLFRIVVVVHSATQDYWLNSYSKSRVSRVEKKLILPKGSSMWSVADRERISKLCEKYAPQTSRPRMPLGYKDFFTCVSFDYKCPNTAPAILWAKKSGSWKPLFENRPRIGLPDWPISLPEVEQEKNLLAAIGQTRLARSSFEKNSSSNERKMLVILALVGKGVHRTEILSIALGVAEDACQKLVDKCVVNGWLTPKIRQTQAGRRELEEARKRSETDEIGDMPLKNVYYVPQSLRESV